MTSILRRYGNPTPMRRTGLCLSACKDYAINCQPVPEGIAMPSQSAFTTLSLESLIWAEVIAWIYKFY